MRLLVIGCFTLWVAAMAAQTRQTPADHPTTQPPATSRPSASTLTEELRPSTTTRSQEIAPLFT